MSTDSFLNAVQTDVQEKAHDPELGGLRLAALTRVLLDRLEDAGIVGDGHVAYYRHERGNLHAEVHGYSHDTEDDVLSLYYCIDGNEESNLGDSWIVRTVPKDTVDRAFRRLESFLRLARSGRASDVDESQPSAELIDLLRDSAGRVAAIEFNVLTTGQVSDRAAAFRPRDGNQLEVWDVVRLERTCASGNDRLSIDLAAEHGLTLPCLVTPVGADGIQVLLASIPGQVLADLYNRYRARLLERNVRSFLQFTGKVNKGIRDTILNSPRRFLSYNNGISATASNVKLDDLGGGVARILVLDDFQVVNGGQTTASIASCARRDGADLREVAVAMKLTVVPPDGVDALVPLISKFANTQNRIQEADFSANHPWHIALERLSRSTWTHPSTDAPRGTRWYYERSRGQYADDLAAKTTPATRKAFRLENPATQKFTKTDLAKFVLTWDQRPAVVSRGAQKCFAEFMTRLTHERWSEPGENDLVRIAGYAILFRTAERLYGELDFQGYRAQVVTYAIARLAHALQKRMPWATIWEEQAIPEMIVAALKIILTGVRDVIVHPPQNRNITEWCKREDCWSTILSLPLQLDLPAEEPDWTDREGVGASPNAAEAALIETAGLIAPDVWYSLAKWARETSSLRPWQRSLSYSLGRLTSRRATPSRKQAVQGLEALIQAVKQGFRHDHVSPTLVSAAESVLRSIDPK